MKNRKYVVPFLCCSLLFLFAAITFAFIYESHFAVAEYIAESVRSPYGIFCIIAVIVQGFLYLGAFFCKNATAFTILIIFGIALFIASLPISGTVCAVVYLLFCFFLMIISAVIEFISFITFQFKK